MQTKQGHHNSTYIRKYYTLKPHNRLCCFFEKRYVVKSIFALLCFYFFSCRSIQYKKDYIGKRGARVFNQYKNNSIIIFSGEAAKLNTILRNDKFLDTVSFRELKKRINVYERFIALHPDSTIVRQIDFPQKSSQIDSFYLNKNKIKYLKRNKIKSPNIHLNTN